MKKSKATTNTFSQHDKNGNYTAKVLLVIAIKFTTFRLITVAFTLIHIEVVEAQPKVLLKASRL